MERDNALPPRKILGILGGLGPVAGIRFADLIFSHTAARTDQEHLDLYLSSLASTPDRSRFLLGISPESPFPKMEEAGRKLVACGAEILAIPCNTAHCFYEAISRSLEIPVLNIVEETSALLCMMGVRTAGVLATSGTVESGAYRNSLSRVGIRCLSPKADEQAQVDALIHRIKGGEPCTEAALLPLLFPLLDRGCECVILGCTELSCQNVPKTVDSLEALAYRSILACGGCAIGFSFDPEGTGCPIPLAECADTAFKYRSEVYL